MACRHFIKHHTQGEQITASIDFFSSDLLRRHVGRGAGDGAFLGEQILFGFAFRYIARDYLGQSKIENLHPSGANDENVSRLYVPVDDPLRVRGFQTFRCLNANI